MQINPTYLAIGNLPEALKHLLRCVLVLGDRYHEVNELLKRNVTLAGANAHELLMHLLLVVDQAQTCQRG